MMVAARGKVGERNEVSPGHWRSHDTPTRRVARRGHACIEPSGIDSVRNRVCFDFAVADNR